MFSSKKEEVVELFNQAKNLNAVIKKILKQEVKRGSPEERFFKDFRNVVISNRATQLIEAFVEKHHPAAERYFMVIAGYIHDEAMVDISSKIIDEYADAFNATYSQNGSDIEITDQKNFEKIAKEALKKIENGLKEHDLPTSSFLKGVLVNRLFTPEVVGKLESVYGS
ncbi:MAG: hypothetical protein GYA55_02000 [SAR324 cluster bacterium]|uniref:Uncharacterized protein n=1 Tax=SAR324 cluster bacterium TaxID=2024889 RepID=A0A7X9FPM0_9DELT|nr:hypothetical protein [SAR324 cluster bacterium]